MLLLQASCERCRKITGEIERKVLRDHFGPVRRKTGFKIKAASEHPSHVLAYPHVGQPRSGVAIPVGQVPGILRLPQLQHPPAVLGQPQPGDRFSFRIRTFVEGGVSAAFVENFPGLSVENELEWSVFFKALAKIAHCYAVAAFGINFFHHFLPELILGDDFNLVPKLVGVPPYSSEHMAGRQEWHISPYFYLAKGSWYLLVTISLFANLNPETPKYCFVAGNISAEGMKREPRLAQALKP